MFYTYLLFDPIQKRFYVGYSSNLKRRWKEHLKGKNWTTHRMGQIVLLFYEAFLSKEDAIRREKYFKTTKGRKSLRQIVRNSISQAGMAEW